MGKGKKKKSIGRQLESDPSIPRSFVFNRGEVGTTLGQLISDMKRVMEPYTAIKLKVRKSNVMKDFVNMAGPLGISHFVIFSKTETAPYMKLCRLPRGPTLTFKIKEYSLMKDIVSIQRRPKTVGSQFKFPPLLVLNNFNNDSVDMKLTTTMLQNLYPPIRIQKVQLGEIRRCTLFNYDSDTGFISFRQYHIEAVPVGVSRGVKKLLKNKIPDLSSLKDISDFVNGGAYLSESEGEEAEDSKVKLPQNVPGRGNVKSAQSAMKLTELGPRMTLELVKIEDGVCEGEVLYHKYVQKTESEVLKLKKKRAKEKKLKEQRKKEQEANVEKKKLEKEAHKEKSLAGMKRKAESDEEDEDSYAEEEEEAENSDIDDAEYYRREVGEEPDKDSFAPSKPRAARPPQKKVKFTTSTSKHTEHVKKKRPEPEKNSKGASKEVKKKKLKPVIPVRKQKFKPLKRSVASKKKKK